MTSDGDIKMIDLKVGDKKTNVILSGSFGVTSDIFSSDLIMKVMLTMSNDFDERQRKLNEALVKENKEPNKILSDSHYNVLIEEALSGGRVYEKEQFDRYEADCVCPEDEMTGLSL